MIFGVDKVKISYLVCMGGMIVYNVVSELRKKKKTKVNKNNNKYAFLYFYYFLTTVLIPLEESHFLERKKKKFGMRYSV